jgi:predicted KAP-like P-loop ATPase
VGSSGLLPDEPITSSREDRLHRGPFAEQLADQILVQQQRECIVIGINGPYGSGKSSFLNMVEERLKGSATGNRQPIVVRFNPWNFSTAEQVVRMFFTALSNALGREDATATAKTTGQKLEQLGDLLAPVAWAPVIGEAAKMTSKSLKALGGLMARSSAEQTPESLKQELNQLLDTYPKHLVIFVDDIDRMEPEKIRLLFRMIRLNADFHKTTYLLAFDRQIAEQALTEDGFPGRVYLEKILQVSFDLPAVQERDISEFLFAELNHVLQAVLVSEDEWDMHRWGNLYHAGFKRFFKTIRDIKRYTNAVRLTFVGPIRTEVNPIDFLVLEAIRVFCPDVYRQIPSRKAILTNQGYPFNDRHNAVNEDRESIEQLFKAGGEYIDIIRELCLELFLPLARIYRNTFYGSDWQTAWRKERRICAQGVFDKYFILGVPSDEVSDAEVRRILALAGDENAFSQALQDLNQRGLCHYFLERMEDFTADFPVDHVAPAIGAILGISDVLPRGERRSFLDLGVEWQTMRVLLRLLHRIEDQAERRRVVEGALKNSRALHGLVQFASWLNPDKKQPSTEPPLLDDDGQRATREIAVQRIEEAARAGRLTAVPQLAYVLFRWKEWGGDASVRHYVADLVKTEKGLRAFLVGFLQERQSQGPHDRVSRSEWIVNRDSIAFFVDPDSLRSHVEALSKNEDVLNDDERKAVAAFLKPSRDN